MIQEILYNLILKNLAATGLYETLAGLVTVVQKEDEQEYQTPEGPEFIKVVKTFPASCLGNSMDYDGNFNPLLPDSSKMSVGFFEGGNVFYNVDHRQTKYSARVRFLAWYNLQMLTQTQACFLPTEFVHATIAALECSAGNMPRKGMTVEASVQSVASDAGAAEYFGRYSFASEPHLFTAPYSWAAFDVNIKGEYKNSCIVPVQAGCNCNII